MWGRPDTGKVIQFPVNKFFLNVPFQEKDKAKALGARWDSQTKRWYYSRPEDAEKFSKWAEKSFMKFEDLTDEQQELITRAKNGENVLVDACIGSGKTSTIQVLCNEIRDKKILYLTYNTLLKTDAQAKITQSNVTVQNYHGFAYGRLKAAELEAGVSDLIQSFIENKPALGRKYDLLVLDEYQDIEQEIAEMLEYIKEKNPDIQIIAVGDMKQKIYDKTTLNVPNFIQNFLGKYSLLSFTKCFRLSEAHAALLGRVWGKEIKGVNPECKVETMSAFEVVDFLSEQKPSDVLCLGARTGDMSRVLNILEKDHHDKYNKRTVYASISDEDRSVSRPSAETAIFTTFDSSKGLERRFCIVFDFTDEYWFTRANMPMTKYDILRNIFCVAASRGKERIIFVKSNCGTALSEETLSTPVEKEEEEFARPFLISEMFSFKYKEDVERCYKCLDIKDITNKEEKEIDVTSSDCLIDLSPCIGILQEAAFFDDYDIDEQIEYAIEKHDDRPKLFIPEDASVEDKVLALTAYQTCYNRYMTQVRLPFVSEEKKNEILNRLGTEFNGKEQVQRDCMMSFLSDSGDNMLVFEGKYDVRKNDNIYELKFKNELSHEDFLQLACYLICTDTEKGILWNTKTGKKYEVSVDGKRKFLNAVVRCITKGAVTRFRPAKIA